MEQTFYSRAIFRAGISEPTTSVSATTYTLLATDNLLLVDDDTAGSAVTITLPSAATLGDGFRFSVKKLGSTAEITLSPDGSETIDGESSLIIEQTGEVETLTSDGTNWQLTSEFTKPKYGSIYVEAGATAQSIPTGATYTKVTGFTTNGQTSPASISDAANDKLVLSRGIWKVDATCSFSTGSSNINVIAAAFLDAVEQDAIHFQRKIGTGSDVGSAAFTGFVVVDQATEDLDMRVRHDDGGSVNFTPVYMSLTALKIG